MSDFLSKVTHTTNRQTGLRAILYGLEGSGKTSLACSAPNVLLMPLEQGFTGVKCNHTPLLKSYDDVINVVAEITASAQKKTFKHKTLVFDSATALERLIHEKTIQTDGSWKAGNKSALTMESALGGYGKAYLYADGLCASLLSSLDELATYAGLNVILTCHSFSAKVLDPTCGEFHQHDLLLHSPKDNKRQGKRELLTQWPDLLAFLHEPMFVTKSSDTFSQGISANKGRMLGLERTPGYVAKNRFNMKGEIAIPLAQSWNYLAQAIYNGSGLDYFNRELV